MFSESQPLGEPVLAPQAQLPPANPKPLVGRTVTLEKLLPTHATDLFPLIGGLSKSAQSLWTYMSDGPYPTLAPFKTSITSKSASTDPFFFAIIDQRPDLPTTGKAIGYLSLMRMTPEHLCIEIGNVMFSPALQRTTGATEAVFLLLDYCFELGYRRVEWKCDSLNEASRNAATRLGFGPEGIHKQHMVVKGRSRDTAWFSMLWEEWEEGRKLAIVEWMGVENRGVDGKQLLGLRDVRNFIFIDKGW
ncbi:acyl-CoA N-acyltransferase [Penicillium bovifimosum]|uniref:Acyl-CoA N-acyltransferase n=1 Tax=Penicillium bovifimosum TaxID=126998 RepID=A0A9W9HAM9_9EURO|nr:acyl-CoA N-acyltransferase [Penicillium bovifimosum]KAJ5143014.1 acyl-CoA N-acyltransferase [Penicillium bovifimosum]